MFKSSSVLSRLSFSLMFLATKSFAEAGGCSQEIFQFKFHNTVLSVNLGDLTEETTDAIGKKKSKNKIKENLKV